MFFLFSGCWFAALIAGICAWGETLDTVPLRKVGRTKGNSPPESVLVFTALSKALWKTLERWMLNSVFFWSFSVGPQKPWPLLARDYSTFPPGAVTVRAFLDRQYLLPS